MKRTISLLVLIALALTLFVSCDDHEHDFSKKWSKDSDYHWHACKVENCSEKSDREEHDFEVVTDENGDRKNVCSVCGEENDKVPTAPEHEHVYAEEYSTSENFHWYACTVENCYEEKGKEEHSFGNPDITYSDATIVIKKLCDVCGYELTETKKVDTQVDSAVSWNEAFKNFELKNFSMKVYLGGKVNHCIITEDSIYYHIGGYGTIYSQKNTDGTYTTYVQYQSDGKDNPFFVLDDTSDEYFTNCSRATVIRVSFEDNFEKFVYSKETGTYKCENIIKVQYSDWYEQDYDDMYCFNNEVKMVDGKISYLGCDYNFSGTEDQKYANFEYYNIGTSETSIPQTVIDNAITESEWNELQGGAK